MKKNTLYFVVILMAVSLVGLIWFQLYWINSVIKLSNERLEKDALESMKLVAQKLERNEMAVVAANSFSIFSTLRPEEDTSLVVYDYQVSKSSDSNNSNHMKIRTNDNRRVQIIVRNDSVVDFKEIVDDESLMDVDIKVTITDEDDTRGEQIHPDRFHKKQEVLAKVVEEMMYYEVNSPVRVHPFIIDSLLREEFNSHGIRLEYEYAILDAGDTSFKIVRALNLDEILDTPLRASLFPNDILANNLSLLVNFPNKTSYLLRDLWTSLLTSVLFILIIIGTFSYVIYKIIQQKKIAELKNDFINNMTHEFKTPIATVTLATEALNEEAVYSSRDTMLRYVGVIQQESKRLGDQVEKVLQLGSMEKNNLTFNKKLTEVNQIIESAIERSRFQIEEKGGQLNTEISSDNCKINVDEIHISNAIFNLVDNAIKYSKGKPEIELISYQKNNEVFIVVADKGIGLSKSQQQHIFEKFYRVPTGNLHDVKGFGLGLNYARYVVETHGGEIRVESQLNKGSKFSIVLPVTK